MNVAAFLVLLLVCVIWGSAFSILKMGLVLIPPLWYVSSRYFLGGLILMAIYLAKTKKMPEWKKDWRPLSGLGLVQTTLMNGLLILGLNYLEAGLTSLILYSYPLIVSLLAHFFLKEEHLNLFRLVGLAVGFTGLAVAVGGKITAAALVQEYAGIVLLLLAAFFWAVATILLKARYSSYGSLYLTSFQMFYGSLFLFIPAFMWEWNQLAFLYSPVAMLNLLFIALVPSALGWYLWFWALDRVSVNQASVFLFLVPVFGLFFSALLLHESFSIYVLLGLVMIAAGIILVNLPREIARKEGASV